MAALTRPDTASYEVHENVVVDTQGTYITDKKPRRIDQCPYIIYSVSVIGEKLYLLISSEVDRLTHWLLIHTHSQTAKTTLSGKFFLVER